MRDFFLSENTTQIINPDSLKMPMFNKAMELELLNISDWLSQQQISEKVITNSQLIISELVKVNQKLSVSFDFENDIHFCFIRDNFLNLRPIFLNRRPMKIIDFAYVADEPFLTLEVEYCLFYLHRTFEKLQFFNEYEIRYDFLHFIFMEIAVGNRHIRIGKD